MHPWLHPGCGYKARSITLIRYHMPTHTGEALFSCNTCGKKFKHKKELNQCQKRHQGRYDHVCTNCDKKFLSKKKLDIHRRVHTGEKPFSCPLCDQKCARQDNLKSHIKKLHSVSRKEAEIMSDLSQQAFETAVSEASSSNVIGDLGFSS